MSDDKSVHPLRRRKHRRGRRKKKEPVTVPMAPPNPQQITSLRARLAQMAKQRSA